MAIAEGDLVVTPEQAVSPSREETAQAFREFVSAVDMLETEGNHKEDAITLVSSDGQRAAIPPAVFDALRFVVHHMAQGDAISIMPLHTKLTTQEAADLLGVSRPFIVKLLDGGEIEFERVGRHRRILLRDFLAYRERRRHEAQEAMTKMAREAQDLAIY